MPVQCKGNLSDEVMLLHGFEVKGCHKSLNKHQGVYFLVTISGITMSTRQLTSVKASTGCKKSNLLDRNAVADFRKGGSPGST